MKIDVQLHAGYGTLTRTLDLGTAGKSWSAAGCLKPPHFEGKRAVMQDLGDDPGVPGSSQARRKPLLCLAGWDGALAPLVDARPVCRGCLW